MTAFKATHDNSADYRAIFLNDVALMDVRAPVEHGKGSFPHTTNLPLMNDSERARVGTCYKQHGQQAAIDLGHSLVSGKLKQARIESWATFARSHPDGYLFCFRGGLRSQVTQQWLRDEAGISYPRIIGGYKAMRTFLLDTTEQALTACDFMVVGGLTGTGKTEVLAALDNAIDLEAHANHRGSSFGKRATPQPAQIDFENAVAIDFLKRRAAGQERFVLEDEGRIIGSCALPLALHEGIQRYPLVWLEDSFDHRVARILQDYVIDLSGEFIALHGAEAGMAAFAERMRQSLANIVKRLGRERYQRLAALLDQALDIQQQSGDVDLHRAWIEGLLREYYDPMYAYQRTKKSERIVFAGTHSEVVDWLQHNAAGQR